MSPNPRKLSLSKIDEKSFFYLGLATGVGVVFLTLAGVYFGLLAQADARRVENFEQRSEAALLSAQTSEILAQQARLVESPLSPAIYPLRNNDVSEPAIGAEAAIIFDFSTERTLYEKNSRAPKRIASLTKLATALAVIEEFNLDDQIKITAEAVRAFGTAGDLREGEIFTVRDLLKAMLIQSSNDAAVALALAKGYDLILARMSGIARALGLADTAFKNVTGLDGAENLASAFDLTRLMIYAQNKPEITSIMSKKDAVVRDLATKTPHYFTTTNELLNSYGVIAGKTGFTTEAKGTYLAIFENDQAKLGLVILGSPDRFSDAVELINWVKRAYVW